MSGRSTSQTFMYAGENELCDCIIDKFLEYPAIMGTANVGTLKLFSSRCAEYEKFKVFFSNPSDCYPRRNSKFKMIKTYINLHRISCSSGPPYTTVSNST